MKKRPNMSEREAYAPFKNPHAPKQPCVELVKRDKKTLDGESNEGQLMAREVI
jgi:hypothetical protein